MATTSVLRHIRRVLEKSQSRCRSTSSCRAPARARPELSAARRACSTSSERHVVSSPHDELVIPDVTFTEFMFSKYKEFGAMAAVIDPVTGRSYSFKDLTEAAIKVASGLTRMGIKKGDRILMFSTNCPEYLILFLACGATGAVLSTANPAYTVGELRRQLEHSRSTTVITVEAFVKTVEDAVNSSETLKLSIKDIIVIGNKDGYRSFSTLLEDDGKAFPENVDIRPDDVITIPYSSGTTGLPKGVMLTHRNIVANMMQCGNLTGLVAGRDRLLGVLPLYHIYGMVASQFCTTAMGCTYVPVPRFVPEDFLSIIQNLKISFLHLVPPLILFLAKDPIVHKYDLTSVRKIFSGAAPLGVALCEQLAKNIPCGVTQAYGLTETSPVVTMDIPPATLGTVGPLVHNTEAKIIDLDTGEMLPVGETGEICFRGPQIMLGYLDNQEATDATIKDGWLYSGDIGSFNTDGRLTVSDRLKELIKYKGFQVPPAELESLLLSHPGIHDAAVFGVPDDQAGEVPRAFVVLKSGQTLTPQEVADFVKENVSSYKQLRGGVRITDCIPKTASGKILRRELKEL